VCAKQNCTHTLLLIPSIFRYFSKEVCKKNCTQALLIPSIFRFVTFESRTQFNRIVTDMKQVALVTGSNRGIGFEVLKNLGQAGYRVICSGRDEAKVVEATNQLKSEGFDADFLLMDTNSAESVTAAASAFAAKYEKLDVLVNNAGGGYDWGSTASTIDLREAEATMQWNLFGPWRVIQAFTPYIRNAAPGSRIVNVSSGGGARDDAGSGFGFKQIGNGSVCAYGISKMALNGLTSKLALEFKDAGILVNSCCPGYTNSGNDPTSTARPVATGAASIAWAAKLGPDGPTGGFFRDGEPLQF
jgi:NAD(P)-dependent dehydrogenase (short-subunit alcohol dehydrogenase family)